MRASPATWNAYFESYGIQPKLRDSFMRYVRRMLVLRLPPIFEFSHLAKLLGRTDAYLASVVNAPKSHYRTFRLPKRSGGHREIAAPYPALLACQQWINHYILSRATIHGSAHGFRKRRSIKTNAARHLARLHLLKMDLADFFPSIKLRRVIGVFRAFGYPPNVSFYLARVCCLDDALPQGAATSPALSNIIAYRLDCRLHGLAQACDLIYTRYADDLAFSGPLITNKFPQIVAAILDEEGFVVNGHKTRLSRSLGRRIVTGLSVRGSELRVPRQYKHALKQELHYIFVNGYLSHVRKRKIRDPLYLDSLYGRLMFWHWVEPGNAFVEAAIPRLRALMSQKA